MNLPAHIIMCSAPSTNLPAHGTKSLDPSLYHYCLALPKPRQEKFMYRVYRLAERTSLLSTTRCRNLQAAPIA